MTRQFQVLHEMLSSRDCAVGLRPTNLPRSIESSANCSGDDSSCIHCTQVYEVTRRTLCVSLISLLRGMYVLALGNCLGLLTEINDFVWMESIVCTNIWRQVR